MPYSYEVVVESNAGELFQEALVDHLKEQGFAHMTVGGMGRSVQEFRKGDDLISLTLISEGHGQHRVVVHSDTVLLDGIIMAALREAGIRFIQPFYGAITGVKPEEFRELFLRGLGDVLSRIRRRDT